MQRLRSSTTRSWILLVGITLAAICLAAGCGTEGSSSSSNGNESISYTVMTYNVLVSLPNPAYDPWKIRREYVAQALLRHEPDLVGLQEPLLNQVNDLLDRVPGYAALPLLFLDTDASILYREDRFQVQDYGIYWLSPTPDEPRSIGFGNFLYRMVLTVSLLDIESGTQIFLINTHFDNTAPSQEMSAPLFLERTEPLAGERPVIITGDFNSRPASEAYGILTQGTKEADAKAGFALQDTFFLAQDYDVVGRGGDDTSYDPSGRIDHVFVAGGDFSCDRWLVDKTTYGDDRKVPSDHFPVVADLKLKRRAAETK